MLKALPSLTAISALIPRFRRSMSLTVCGLTSSACARRYPEIFIGLRNSCFKISPGWTAQAAAVRLLKAICGKSPSVIVVISDFNVVSMTVFPGETNSVFVVDPNCVLASPLFMERVELVSGWNFEIVELCCCFNHLQFPHGHRAYIRGNSTALAHFPKCHYMTTVTLKFHLSL